MGPCIAYCMCSRVGSVAVAVPAPPLLCFAPLSIVTAVGLQRDVMVDQHQKATKLAQIV